MGTAHGIRDIARQTRSSLAAGDVFALAVRHVRNSDLEGTVPSPTDGLTAVTIQHEVGNSSARIWRSECGRAAVFGAWVSLGPAVWHKKLFCASASEPVSTHITCLHLVTHCQTTLLLCLRSLRTTS